MTNVNSNYNGQGETLDPIVGADGVAYLKAAGDSLGIPPDNSDPIAPQLVQIVGASGSQYAATPTGLEGTEGTGTLGAGTYYHRVSATTAAGETLACPEVGTTIAATHGVDLTWNAVAGATGYRVYGRSTGAELFIAATAGGVTTYTDSGSITPSGALPTSNTARVSTAVETTGPATATRTSVNDNNADTLILAANTSRKGATITNASAEILYLCLGTATATTSDYTATLAGAAAAPFSYYEVPYGFTGQIRGIWAANGSGAAKITELT